MFSDADAVLALVRAGFRGKRVLVVGDAMLDRYLWGEVSRISPEAPVPVVRLTRRSATAGGAANVAANLARLGCTASLCAAVGADAGRDELAAMLQAQGVDPGLLTVVPGFPTIVKTRVLGGHQQVVRIDEEEPRKLDAVAVAPLASTAAAAVASHDAVILSDYAKGVVQPAVAQAVIAAARAKGIPVLVDPKGADWAKYQGATTVTPNTGELATATGIPAHDYERMVSAGAVLRDRLGLAFLTFTRGEHGITLIGERTTSVPAQAREVFDVSGAGDTVIATMAAAIAGGLSPEDAMRLANAAAGIVVGKVGTVPIERAELEHELIRLIAAEPEGKVRSWSEATSQIARWKAAGEEVVFTNGCFDILHAGHCQILEQSRRVGDRLVVGLNADDSVRRLKGPTRPVNPQEDRAAVLAALACVDLVVLFDQDTPLELITTLRPDVLVKGQDYREDQVVGGPEVKSWGGRVALLPLLPGRSTTNTIKRANCG
ncbi:MAG TPA: bifunctional heptose 7-phosphate kinase/heptose 1-phosphate adenyltransferase [Planctomycetes bacterium]|nr:bifunctional heptose 7-phosphate kinase/heptose 1-phosphate adenyltransferase [Planctomycetota bacterium]